MQALNYKFSLISIKQQKDKNQMEAQLLGANQMIFLKGSKV